MLEKYVWKSGKFKNIAGCNNVSKDFLHFKKANFSRGVLLTYSEICIFLCDAIDLKQSVERPLK